VFVLVQFDCASAPLRFGRDSMAIAAIDLSTT